MTIFTYLKIELTVVGAELLMFMSKKLTVEARRMLDAEKGSGGADAHDS